MNIKDSTSVKTNMQSTDTFCSLRDQARVDARALEVAKDMYIKGSQSVVETSVPEHSDIHSHAEYHHHHYHAQGSHHGGGHHLLQVEHLSIGFTLYDYQESFFSAKKTDLNVIQDLSISVHNGEIMAIVGASGSGKTLLADAIMGLYAPNSKVCGTIYFDGVLQTADSLAQLRGRDISFVPQSISSLNPVMKIGKQIGGSKKKRHELYDRYGLNHKVDNLYPFELSGGMARRVLLTTALMTNPKLIIADEPTPGLDLELAVKAMEDFRVFANEGGGVLLITHDIELALRVADRVAVFKDGSVIEETAVENFSQPELLDHPFSRNLWHALPEHNFRAPSDNERELYNSSEISAQKGSRE